MPFRVLVVSKEDIEANFDVARCVDVVAEGFRLLATGAAELSPKFHWEFSTGRSAAFSSTIAPLDVMGTKLANLRPANLAVGLTRGILQVLLYRPATGEPLAILDGSSVTTLRTAAAAAVGARALARPSSSTMALIGPGEVGRACLAAVASVFPIERAYIVDLDIESARAMVEAYKHRYSFELVASQAREAVEASDIVVTMTTATSPVVQDAWVSPGTHISAMGADWRGKQELETSLLLRSRFVTDNITQCLEIGEANVPFAQGLFLRKAIHAELGDVLIGRSVGRQDDEEITVFDSSGLAVQDVATGHWIMSEASQKGIGNYVVL